MDTTAIHSQAMFDNALHQRNTALNAVCALSGDLAARTVELAEAQKRIAELEAKVKELEGKDEKKPK